jgi:hypothetical protein
LGSQTFNLSLCLSISNYYGEKGKQMTYTLSTQEKQTYIRAEVSGERKRGQEAQDAFQVWLAIAELCRNKGISRALVIFNLSGELPIMAGYDIASSGLKMELLTSLTRVALVDNNEQSRENNRFAETVAANRGAGGGIKVFGDEKEALDWLLA